MTWLRRSRGGRDGDTPFRRMLGFSAFVHLVLVGFFISYTNVPAPKWTFGPVHSVQLVSLSDQTAGRKAPAAISREVLQPRPSPPAIILRKPVETTKAVPLRKAEVRKAPTPGIEKAIDALKEKVQSAPKPVPSAVTPPPTARQQKGEAAGGAMDPYYAEIWARIRGQWSMPRDILPRGNVESVINARILRNGAVVDIGFEKRSGNRYFDESAVRAIRKASPLPPLPAWIRGDSIEIGIRFRSAELQ